jgi:hypothetical protein
VTADLRLRIGAWAALVAAFLGPITVLAAVRMVPSPSDVTTIALVILGLQALALLVAVIGLRDLLDHLSRNVALAVLAAGAAGSVSYLVADGVFLVSGPSTVPQIVALVGRVLLAVWMVGTAIAVGRGNGGRTATLGWLIGGGQLVTAVAVIAGLENLAGWNFLVGTGEVVYLILLWRFALAALRPDPEFAA